MPKDDPNLNDNETAHCHKSFLSLFLTRFTSFQENRRPYKLLKEKNIFHRSMSSKMPIYTNAYCSQ